ncbi:MAG: type II toxin-antitoxin system VapC family toxin [Salinivirgaceae bacterium]|jgi:PIN domain nuclease of toxin-antitoxin system|nr:type II toxin-antitoxin system VapC family toxin [Salinivirgaceae bacterium]
MNLLLDTHVVLWFITDNPKLPQNLKRIIEDESNTCFISMASLWEVGIKYSIGRLELQIKLEELFKIIEESGIQVLPISTEHILVNTTLAFIHQDPFDRLIIAQSISENLTLVSKDQYFSKYPVDLLSV